MAAISFNTLGENDGTTNDTTAVTVIAAPGAGVFRSSRILSVTNTDTANATLIFRLNNSGTFRIIAKVLIVPGQSFLFGTDQEFIVLANTSTSLEILLAGAVTTNQLDFVSSWGDYQT